MRFNSGRVSFASLKLCFDCTLTDLAYYAVCGPAGNHSIRPDDHTKSYYIVADFGHPHFFEQDVFRTGVEFGNATINEEDLQMLRLIRAKPDITYTELSEQLDLHRATVARGSVPEKRVNGKLISL